MAPIENRSDSDVSPATTATTAAHEKHTFLNTTKNGKLNTKEKLRHYVSLFIGILWLAPICALLILNARGYSPGPSLWCPTGKCRAGNYLDYTNMASRRLDESDHNVLGILQVVAKMLELWFGFVAAGLVYWIAYLLGKHSGGIPLAYLFSHSAYSDPLNFLSTQPWVCAKKASQSNPDMRRSRLSWRLTGFVVFTFAMCGIFNLMGPATAALCTPTLQWVNTAQFGQIFKGLESTQTPHGVVITRNTSKDAEKCPLEELAKGRYACTNSFSAPDLDRIAVDILGHFRTANISQERFVDQESFATVSELGLKCLFNLTWYTSESRAYTPIRQTMRDLALLYRDVIVNEPGRQKSAIRIKSKNTIDTLRRSRDGRLVQDGPIIWSKSRWGYSRITAVNVSGSTSIENRQIQCYKIYDHGTILHCARIGEGWGSANKQSHFWMEAKDNYANFDFPNLEKMDITVSSTEAVAWFNLTRNEAIPACLSLDSPSSTPLPLCDWDRDFSPHVRQPATLLFQVDPHINSVIFTFEYNLNSSFAQYTHDLRNDFFYTRTDPWDEPSRPLTVHPDWLLAGWSIDVNKSLSDNRIAAHHFTWHLLKYISLNSNKTTNPPSNLDSEWEASENGISLKPVMVQIADLSILHSLSHIPYYSSSSSTTDRPDEPDPLLMRIKHEISRQDQLVQLEHGDPLMLLRYGIVWAWAFGFNSGTSKVAVVVVGFGILVTVLRTVLCLVLGKSHKEDGVAYIGAALRYEGFEGEEAGERRAMGQAGGVPLAAKRWRMERDEDGELKLIRVGGYHSVGVDEES